MCFYVRTNRGSGCLRGAACSAWAPWPGLRVLSRACLRVLGRHNCCSGGQADLPALQLAAPPSICSLHSNPTHVHIPKPPRQLGASSNWKVCSSRLCTSGGSPSFKKADVPDQCVFGLWKKSGSQGVQLVSNSADPPAPVSSQKCKLRGGACNPSGCVGERCRRQYAPASRFAWVPAKGRSAEFAAAMADTIRMPFLLDGV